MLLLGTGWVGGWGFDRVERVVRQQVVEVPAPPQQPEDDSGFVLVDASERDAARDLQKRVLLGSARHWAHVPGPERQEVVVVVLVRSNGRDVATSPSDGGGVNPCWDN